MRVDRRWIVLATWLACGCVPRADASSIEPSVVRFELERVTTFRVRGIPPDRAFSSAGGALAIAPDLVVRVGDVAARIVGADSDAILVRLDGSVPVGSADLRVTAGEWTTLSRDALVVTGATFAADGGATDASATRCVGDCTCEAGERCAMTCTTAPCTFTCASGARCDFDCGSGEGCTFVCEQGSTCTTHCVGDCTTRCDDAARCSSR